VARARRRGLAVRARRARRAAVVARQARCSGGARSWRAPAPPDLSTFLLVGYFAAAGLRALAVGRARQVAGARQLGLALAVYAALKALAQASALQAVGLRVGSYLWSAPSCWASATGTARPASRPRDAAV
jgi:hypothetical protein